MIYYNGSNEFNTDTSNGFVGYSKEELDFIYKKLNDIELGAMIKKLANESLFLIEQRETLDLLRQCLDELSKNEIIRNREM